MNVVGHRRTRSFPLPRFSEEDPPVTNDADPRQGGTIRGRLASILAFPVAAVILLLGIVAAGEVENYRAATDINRAVTLSLAVGDLVQELQTERGLTAGLLGGNVGFRDELPPAREKVDQRRVGVEQLADDGSDLGERVALALRELDGLAALRVGTDTGTTSRADAFGYYTDQIAALSGIDFGLDRTTDQDLNRNVAVLQALGDMKESTAQQRAFLNGVFSASGFIDREFVEFAAMRAAGQAARDRFERQADAEQRAANAYVFDTGAARTAAYFEQVALDAADGRPMVVNPQSWWSALTTVLDDMAHMQQYVGSQIQARAETLQNIAATRIAGLGGVVGLSFTGAFLLLAMATRSITRPLAALAAEADGVAGDRLPQAVARVQSAADDEPLVPPEPVQVPKRSTTEIQQVASALDRVQSAAFSLATEQAMLRRRTNESLANLGRRNQNLLRRQIGFITNLEREETDPSGLANLFELDHLATRMRRNAESLLVLAGAATPRQWSAPLPVADIIRAALSEVEEYRRVSLRRIDDAYVAGAAVGGVAHMLAELVENGLSFSPPDSEVEIQGRQLGETYLIAVIDSGVGMAADDLDRANELLRGVGDFVVAPSRYLGHHVVGHLARQLRIDVALSPSPVTGITARVTLPADVLANPASTRTALSDTRPAAVTGSFAMVTESFASVTGSFASVTGSPSTGYPAAVSAGEPAATATAAPATLPPPPALAGRSGAPANGSGQSYLAIDTVEYLSAPTAGTMPGVPGGLLGPASGGPGVTSFDTDTGTGGGGDPARTRNGLVRRPPRTRPESSAPATRADRATAVDHSPGEVRARLTALRAGVQRGETERQTTSAGWDVPPTHAGSDQR